MYIYIYATYVGLFGLGVYRDNGKKTETTI